MSKTAFEPKKSGSLPLKPQIAVSTTDYDRLALLAAAAADRNAAAGELLRELDRASVLPPSQLAPDVITMNSDAEYRDEETGRVHRVRLVYPGEADISRHYISVLTPIGAALIGLRKGQSIPWRTPSGEDRSLTVLAVG
jgi:regulator of nucleoside diphosphate kinase